MKNTLRVAIASAALLAGPTLVGLATPAAASGGSDAVIRTGNCSGAADWKLKAKPDDGRLEVEFEVDTNRNGQNWNWTLRRNGTAFAQGTATTRAPSGSFSIERRTANPAGADTIVGTATNVRTGQTCRGQLTI
jgi:hypothetical protein